MLSPTRFDPNSIGDLLNLEPTPVSLTSDNLDSVGYPCESVDVSVHPEGVKTRKDSNSSQN